MILCCGIFLLFGCGRYAPVIAPELTAPEAVKFLPYVPSATGVSLTWIAPQKDNQGKKLTKLDGFKIYRRDVPISRQARKSAEANYKLVGIVADTTIDERIKREKAERALLKSTRRVALSQEELSVTFLDSNVVAGGLYLYKVIPFNSLATESLAKTFIEVLYDGEKSVSRTIYDESDAGNLLAEVKAPEATPAGGAMDAPSSSSPISSSTLGGTLR